MKRVVIILVILILLISPISAFSFKEFFGKINESITGKITGTEDVGRSSFTEKIRETKENTKLFVEKVKEFFTDIFKEEEKKKKIVGWPKEKPLPSSYAEKGDLIYSRGEMISEGDWLKEEFVYPQTYLNKEELTQAQTPKFKEGEILIKFKENTINSEEQVLDFLNSISGYEIKTAKKLFPTKTELGLNRIYKINFDKEVSPFTLIREFNKNNYIEYVEPNYIYHLLNTPNDPFFNEQWGHQNIQSELAWNIETGNEEVVIAIVDTGVDYTHPDLINNIWINEDEIPNNRVDDDNNDYVDDYYGYDFFNYDGDPKDDFGHGTHCAGISAAVTNNNRGIAGTCWNCKIMSVKFLGDEGWGSAEGGAFSIIYAAGNGADVISNSWGGGPHSRLLEDAINYAYNRGSFLIAAAGNYNIRGKMYPAGYENMFAVSATFQEDEKTYFSNYGSWVDVGAPGQMIYSTMPTYHVTMNDWGYEMNYDYMSGTSMATPFVAGLIGLIKSKNPNFNNQEIFSLLHTAVDIPNSQEYIGTGRVNAYQEALINSIPISILNPRLDDIEIKDGRNIDIIGTSTGDDFQYYVLEYGLGSYPSEWNLIRESNTPVINGVLGSLNTLSVNDGDYSIRLRTRGNEYNEISQDIAFLEIDNTYITFPLNYDILRAGDIIEINGTIQGNGFQNYIIEYGVGENPTQWFSNGITLINNGNSLIFNNTLATWDTSSINQASIYTIRLRINFNNRQDKEFVKIYLDPTLKEGWPQRIRESVGYLGYLEPVVDDINNDGVKEIIVYSGGVPPKLYVYRADGRLLNGWPVEVNDPPGAVFGVFLNIPVIGDINNDGLKEIIVVKTGNGYYCSSNLIAYKSDGSILNGWPKNLNHCFTSPSITLEDLNWDNALEIIIFDTSHGGNVRILDNNGNILPGWPKDLETFVGSALVTNPAIGKFDNDPNFEVVVAAPTSDGGLGSNWGIIHIYKLNGSEVSGWPIETQGIILSSPAVGDINYDGYDEIIVATMYNYARGPFNEGYALHVFDKNGNYLPGWPQLLGEGLSSSPALADFNNDNYLEIVVSTLGTATYIFDYQGNIMPNWPQDTCWYDYYSPIIGDVNEDGNLDIITTAGSLKAGCGVYGWDFEGSYIEGFPKLTEDYAEAPAVISDIDNDGKLELIASSYRDVDWENQEYKHRGSIYVWDIQTNYHEDRMPWPTFQHDNKHTGNYYNYKPFVCGGSECNNIEGDGSQEDCNAITNCPTAWGLTNGDSGSGCWRNLCCGDDSVQYWAWELEAYIITNINGVNYEACCDSASDCVDATGTCREGVEPYPYCNNGIDDDCDGLFDCDDPDCYGRREICDNGIDDDCDGLFDCDDPDCEYYWKCECDEQHPCPLCYRCSNGHCGRISGGRCMWNKDCCGSNEICVNGWCVVPALD